MTIRIAINGYGRIGRNVLRALYESDRRDQFQIVAINDLAPPESLVHLTRYDTAHGRFAAEVALQGDEMLVNGDGIKLLAQPDPAQLPWQELAIDVVMECTGVFANRAESSVHLQAGAKKVLVSQPAGEDVKTIVYGVNQQVISADDTVVSNASCSTNCLAALVHPLHQKLGLLSGMMTTVHAYTNDQMLTDGFHNDLRRARAAGQSIIPTKTGAAIALGRVLPELDGKIQAFALRVPTVNVSMVDLNFIAARESSVDEVNNILKAAAANELQGVVSYSDEPLVSADFNHHAASSAFDATLTRVQGSMIKVCAWYDNEWGFSNRMLDTCQHMMTV